MSTAVPAAQRLHFSSPERLAAWERHLYPFELRSGQLDELRLPPNCRSRPPGLRAWVRRMSTTSRAAEQQAGDLDPTNLRVSSVMRAFEL